MQVPVKYGWLFGSGINGEGRVMHGVVGVGVAGGSIVGEDGGVL